MLELLIAPVSKILDKFIPDADTKLALAHEIATLSERHAQEIATAQIAVNLAEAQSGSVFKGGWRPFVGWTCGVSLAFNFVVLPMLDYAAAILAPEFKPPPMLDMATMMPVLMGMLGLGGLRTAEKMKGVARP
jgi:hypothetical protein